MNNTLKPESAHSDSFEIFCEGDTFPLLKKRITTLIVKTHEYIVFLDEEQYVQWSTKSQDQLPKTLAT